MKIGIIGTGVFSTAVAILLAANKENNITMWSENEALIEEFKKTKKLNQIIPNKTIPKNITITNQYEEALQDAKIVFLMTSATYIEKVCKDIKHIIPKDIPVCIGTKGINDKKMVHSIVHKYLNNKITIMSGPTFSKDVANEEPIGFVLASKDKKARKIIKDAFLYLDVDIEETNDVEGVALCSCLKNIYALGSGILSGLGYHESTNALYLTQVFKELYLILYHYNSSLDTLHGYAGLGDLIATCNSPQSRNFMYGEMIGKKTSKKTQEKFLSQNTIEGLQALEPIHKLLHRKHIKCPLLNTLYKIIIQEAEPQILVKEIIKKDD